MWTGPFTIEDVLRDAILRQLPQLPEKDGVYVVSESAWSGQPTADTRILYVGSNTGKSARFRTRVGDMIADLFGFYGEETGHHSGGQSLHQYCLTNRVHPLSLWLGWLSDVPDTRECECHLYDTLKPLLNKKRPPESRRA